MSAPPLIDLTLLEDDGTGNAESALAQQMKEACRDIGFFYVRSPLLTANIIEDAFEAVNALFDLPIDVKESVAAHKSPLFRGYQGETSESHSCTPPDATTTDGGDVESSTALARAAVKDLKESYAIGALGADSSMHGDNQWPSEEHFSLTQRAKLQQYWDSMLLVSKQVSKCLALSLGLEPAFFTRNMRNPIAQMVMLRYPPPKDLDASGRPLQSGCGAHTDCGFLTLLAQQSDARDALQIKNKDGQWILAPQLKDGVVLVNLGDMAQRWSNDYYKSTWHRVHNESGKIRHSIPFFCNLDYGAIVDPSESVCKGELKNIVGEAKYGKTCAGDYICQRLGLMYDGTVAPIAVEGGSSN